jgi:hypothetical protein
VKNMSTKNNHTPSTSSGINTLKDFRMSMAWFSLNIIVFTDIFHKIIIFVNYSAV